MFGGSGFGGGFNNRAGTTMGTVATNPPGSRVTRKSVIPDLGSDSPSCVSWNAQGNCIAIGSWDKCVRIYEVHPNGNVVAMRQYQHATPVTCLEFAPSGTQVFSGSCDGEIKLYDIPSSQEKTVAKHDSVVIGICFVQELNMLVTCSTDQSVRFWDAQTFQPQGGHPLPLPPTSMCCSQGFLHVALTPNAQVTTYSRSSDKSRNMIVQLNLAPIMQRQAPQQNLLSTSLQTSIMHMSPLTLPGKPGVFVVGADSRAEVLFQAPNAAISYTFRCHRDVTSRKAFMPLCCTGRVATPDCDTDGATGGSDGMVSFWKLNEKKNHASLHFDAPVMAMKYNPQGNMLAVVTGYDWSKGHAGYKPGLTAGFIVPIPPATK